MAPLYIGAICLASTFAAGMLGIWLRPRLPASMVDAEANEAIKMGVGLVATMTALLLGLIMASAKSNFDAIDLAIKDAAAKIITVDRALNDLGPPAEPARALWRTAVGQLARERDSHTPQAYNIDGMSGDAMSAMERAAEALGSLTPESARHQHLQEKTLDLIDSLLASRWMTHYLANTTTPNSFLIVLLLWLAITFACFGLVSPNRPTVVIVFFLCSLSAASALFITLELELPFDDIVRVSWQPIQAAHRKIAP